MLDNVIANPVGDGRAPWGAGRSAVPRGLPKADAGIAVWMKDIALAPRCGSGLTTTLSAGRSPAAATPRRLRRHAPELEKLRELARHDSLTPVFGARDEAHNDAVVLREALLEP